VFNMVWPLTSKRVVQNLKF